MNHKDQITLQLIIKYVNEVFTGIERYSLDYEKFSSDHMLKNGISMSVMQIGENVKRLSKEVRQKYNKIPWALIGDMRNRFAHGYDAMNEDIIWEVVTEDLPQLKVYCQEILEKLENE